METTGETIPEGELLSERVDEVMVGSAEESKEVEGEEVEVEVESKEVEGEDVEVEDGRRERSRSPGRERSKFSKERESLRRERSRSSSREREKKEDEEDEGEKRGRKRSRSRSHSRSLSGERERRRKFGERGGGVEGVKKVKCYRCGGSGHFQDECVSSSEPTSRGGAECYKCNGKGHFARECPNIKRDVCYICNLKGHHGLDCPVGAYHRQGLPSNLANMPLLPLQMQMYMAQMQNPFATSSSASKGEYFGSLASNYQQGPELPYGDANSLKMQQVPWGYTPGASNMVTPALNPYSRGFSPMGSGCYKCGETGHIAKNCQLPSDQQCFRCGKSGHIAKNCTNHPDLQAQLMMGRTIETCFRCGEPGHFARDCIVQSGVPAGRDACFKCGQQGHIAKECPNEDNRLCFFCKRKGHLARECPEQLLRAR